MYGHLRKDYGARIFEVDELVKLLKEAGFKGFNPEMYDSILLLNTRKIAD